jgi:mannose-1-phosphate guanylyltransferase
MKQNFYVVIFAGGSGTRLWPMSRQQMPKQFHILTGKRSLLQDTYDRVVKVVPPERIFVLTIEQFRGETKRQLRELPSANIIIEPIGRNTTAATALAAEVIAKRDPNGIVATLASDHVVSYPERFGQALKDAVVVVNHDKKAIVAIGIEPTDPNTGLGYIQRGQLRAFDQTKYKTYKAKRFVEKPDLPTAKRYVHSKEYFWNAAYFIWHVQTMQSVLARFEPELAEKVQRFTESKENSEQRAIYETIHPVPIDTSVMEKYDNLYVIPVDLGWSDIGNWASLHEILKIESGTDSIIKGDHIGFDTENVLILGHNKLIATVGLKDVIVVDTPDVMLICHKDKAQDIKKILEQLTEQGRETFL